MEVGWDASHHLPALLAARKKAGLPWTQAWLASTTGIQRETINGYCTGRLGLGDRNAELIAEVLNVSVAELGAPAEEVDVPGRRLRRRLRALEATVAEQGTELEAAYVLIRELTERVVTLEQPRRRRSGGQG